jgi:hypothetical protein
MGQHPAKKNRSFDEATSMEQDFALDPTVKDFTFSNNFPSSPAAPSKEASSASTPPTGSPLVGDTAASGSGPHAATPPPQPISYTTSEIVPNSASTIDADTTRQNISNSSSPADTLVIPPTKPMDNDEDYDESAAVINDTVTFAAATVYSSIVRPDESRAQLMNRINEYGVTHFNGQFIRSTITGSGDLRRLIVQFKQSSARTAFCSFDHSSLALPDQDTPTFHEHDPRQIAVNLRSRQLVASDIPFDLKPNVVRASFQKFGNIAGFKMTTRPGALFQTAIITFDSPDAVSALTNKWCTWVQGACIRIHPAAASSEDIKARTANSAVLVGLPPGIRAIDLGAIMSDTNARAIGLPRHVRSYKNKPWAYFDFASVEDRDNALDVSSAITFRNRMHYLTWMLPDDVRSLCVRCGSQAHKAADCDAFASRGRPAVSKSLQATYDRLKPASYSTKLIRPKTSRNRSSSRSRSRSRKRNRDSNRDSDRIPSEKEKQNAPPGSDANSPVKKVSYARAVSTGNSLQDSIHAPRNKKPSDSTCLILVCLLPNR